MASEWEQRGLGEKELLQHHQKQAFELSSKQIAKRGFAIGLVGFVLTYFVFGGLNELAPLIAGFVLNLGYLFFYPKFFNKIMSGDLGFLVIHIASYFVGFVLFATIFTIFAVLLESAVA